jgi:hypothetical protein
MIWVIPEPLKRLISAFMPSKYLSYVRHCELFKMKRFMSFTVRHFNLLKMKSSALNGIIGESHRGKEKGDRRADA